MTILVDIVVLLLKAVLGKLVADELFAAMSDAAIWIASKAASKFPPEDRARFQEEWSSVLEDTRTPLRKLVRAIGFYWAATRLTRVPDARRQPRAVPAKSDSVFGKRNLLKTALNAAALAGLVDALFTLYRLFT